MAWLTHHSEEKPLWHLHLSSDSPIQFVPYSEVYGEGFEDMRRRVPSLDKIRAIIGHQPLVRPEAIVKLVADYFRRNSLESDDSSARLPLTS